MKPLILSLIAVSAVSLSAGEHFDRARELYKDGPSKAKEILTELDLELRDHPEDVKAYLLKAMVQMGTEDTTAALKTLDEAAKEDAKAKSIHREIHFLRARCLCQDGDFAAAKKALQPFSGFFMDDAASEARYDQLMATIEEELKKQQPKGEPATKPK